MPLARLAPLAFFSLPFGSLRTFSDILMRTPLLGAFGVMTLLASAVALAAENIEVNAPNGRPFLVLRILDVGETSSEWGYTAEREVPDAVLDTIVSGVGYWGTLLEKGLANTSPVVIEFIPLDVGLGGASASSPPTGTDGNTWLSAALIKNDFSFGRDVAAAGVLIGVDGWYSGSFHSLASNDERPHLAGTVVHELTHALGVGAILAPEAVVSDEYVQYPGYAPFHYLEARLADEPSAWHDGLRDIDGDRALPGMTISWKNTGRHDEFNLPMLGNEGDVNDLGANGVYFTGEHVSEVIQDALIAYPNNLSEHRVNGVPVVGWEFSQEYYLFPELSHIELQNSLLSHQQWRNWSIPMEAELAVMQDLGFALDRRDWFGYSIYQSGNSETDRRVFVNTNPYYDRTLRPLTGLDQPVIDFLDKSKAAQMMIDDISAFLTKWIPSYEAQNRHYLTIAIGCTGGQHRSVYVSQKLADRFAPLMMTVVRHRQLARKGLIAAAAAKTP